MQKRKKIQRGARQGQRELRARIQAVLDRCDGCALDDPADRQRLTDALTRALCA